MSNILKILTYGFVFWVNASLLAFSAVLVEEEFNTHLRWNIYVEQKKDILVTKAGNGFYIETFNRSLYEKLKAKLNEIVKEGSHFKKLKFKGDELPKNPAQIRVDLANQFVELFSFYRPKDKKYILDFWVDKKVSKKIKDKKAIVKRIPKEIQVPVIKIKAGVPKTIVKDKKDEEKYRDFRYGASLIWDYPALMPKLDKKIDVKNKTPEHLHPIKDVDLGKKRSQDNHLRLTINLYRNGKYGLMFKSIQLYEKKYGLDEYNDINNFMKALSLIKENIGNKDKAPFKSAIYLLESVLDSTKNYKLKRAIYFYLIQHYIDRKSMVTALEKSKELYIESKVVSDMPSSRYAANSILKLLCQLGQIEKINKFSSERLVEKIVSPQTILAYRIASLLKDKNPKRVIKIFEKNRGNLQKPIDPSILFNAAESYFRTAQYKKSIKAYQEFLQLYNHLHASSLVRVRLALSYEILDNNISKTLRLYEDAINHASDLNARYEAKLRYVALRNTRKINPGQLDNQVVSFLDYPGKNKKNLNSHLKNLLWMVRLRVFINAKDYEKALSYITSLPFDTLSPKMKRIFEGDGSEIVYGMIKDFFDKGKMTKVVNLWEMYKDVYGGKVSRRPYLSFIVARSYIEIGFEDSADLILEKLRRIDNNSVKIFPMWVSRVNYGTIKNLSSEISVLRMLQKGKWNSIVKNIDQFNISSNRRLFYETVSLYNLKYFDQAIKVAESFLLNSAKKIPLDKEETRRFFEAYLESLYATASLDKFKKTSKAILNDIESSKNVHLSLSKLAEKTRYLLIESLASSKRKDDQIIVESDAKNFLEMYKNSIYKDRVKFLWASSLVSNKKESDAIKILDQLVKDNKTSRYIREISKTEIANLKLHGGILN